EWGHPMSARTGGDGRFEIRCTGRPSWNSQLGIRHPDFAPAATDPIPDGRGAAKEILVELSKGGAIEGFVHRADGAPGAGARVRAGAGPELAKTAGEVAAGPDGSFRIDRLAPGHYDVGAFVRDIGPEGRWFWAPVDVEEGRIARADFLAVRREPGCTLRGRV